MKKKLTALSVVCILCIFVLTELALAQQHSVLDVREWPMGKVVLVNGDTVYGALRYYRSQDVVNVLHVDGSISAFTPVNVEYFVAQEMPSGRSFTFRTLHWDLGKPNSDFTKPTFFEELNRGMVILLVRETYINNAGTNVGPMNSNTYSYTGVGNADNQQYEQVAQKYFLLLPNNKIVTLRNLRKDLHSLFGKKSKDVKSYIKLNKLDYHKRHELVAIINYFNAISNTTGLAY